jgi:hypothetical protein
MADLPINSVTGKRFDPTLPMFHGTSSAFNLGDVITPAEVAGVPSVHNSSENLPNLTSNAFATQDMDMARTYAKRAAKKFGGSPLVYRVEPVDLTDLGHDWDAPDDSSWMSSKGFRVVSPAETHSGRSAVEFANGDMKYAEDGRSYFLHHSRSSGIKVGEQIRTTGVGKQTTAGDAIFGHSYAWDARTGVREAVANQVSMRSSLDGAGVGAGDFSVYLTSANTSEVFPDINVPGTAARAIRGTQDVLEEIKIPAHLTNDEAQELIRQTIARRGITEAKRGRKKSNRFFHNGGEGRRSSWQLCCCYW